MYAGEWSSPPSRRMPSTTQDWYALHGPCPSAAPQEPRRTVAFRKSFYDDKDGVTPTVTFRRLHPASTTAQTMSALATNGATSRESCQAVVATTVGHEHEGHQQQQQQQQPSDKPDVPTTTTTSRRHRDRAAERSALPLSQRTQPESPDALLLERNRAMELFRWVKRRAGKVEGIERAAILMGPPGSGKTAAARVFLRAAGFQVVEFGPGSLSAECSLADQVRRVVQRKPLPGVRPPAVLIDDFDGLCAIDRDAESTLRRSHTGDGVTKRARVGNLVGVIAEAKASSPPIIVCSNDSGSAEVRLVREVCHETWFDAVPRARLTYLAKTTAARQNCALSDADAGRLADAACGDIRRLLNGLDLWLRVNPTPAGRAVSTPVDMTSDTFLSNFTAVEALIAGKMPSGNRKIECTAATGIYRADPLLRRAMVHHNYVRAVAEATNHAGGGGDLEALDRISSIADNFAAADAMDYGTGVSGTGGGEQGQADGAGSWRAGARSGGAVGWAHGANPATALLWAWSTRTLAPRPDSMGPPEVSFCKPSSTDRAQYGDAHARLVHASAVMLPTTSLAGPRESLVLGFDLARSVFVDFATNAHADHAYANRSKAERKAIVDKMVWVGVTPESLARLLAWPCMRQRAQQGGMPPPAMSDVAGRRPCRLLEDLRGRRQALAVMGDARTASLVMPSDPAAMAPLATRPKPASSASRMAPADSDAAYSSSFLSSPSLDREPSRKRKHPSGNYQAGNLPSSSSRPSGGRGKGARIPCYHASTSSPLPSPSSLYRPPDGSFPPARSSHASTLSSSRTAYRSQGARRAGRGRRGRGRGG
nr:replication factor C large subunit [Pandoravirus massiliensis]